MFAVNPMQFVMEYNELKIERNVEAVAKASPDCPVTFPHDMDYNRRTEETNKHGSCGMGIWATFKRQEKCPITIRDFQSKKFRTLWQDVSDYYGFTMNSGFRDHFEYDVKIMNNIISVYDEEVYDGYDKVVFEMGQGLELSKDAIRNYPHISGSDTGIGNAIKSIDVYGKDCDVDIYYVTRSYVTKHGDGPLPYEATRTELHAGLDRTNVPNQYQGTLRFAYLDVGRMLRNIEDDSGNRPYNVVVTHLNETYGLVKTTDGDQIPYWATHESYDESSILGRASSSSKPNS
jgi:adenylosuccinate synthase